MVMYDIVLQMSTWITSTRLRELSAGLSYTSASTPVCELSFRVRAKCCAHALGIPCVSLLRWYVVGSSHRCWKRETLVLRHIRGRQDDTHLAL